LSDENINSISELFQKIGINWFYGIII
jgi:hypothetical protein